VILWFSNVFLNQFLCFVWWLSMVFYVFCSCHFSSNDVQLGMESMECWFLWFSDTLDEMGCQQINHSKLQHLANCFIENSLFLSGQFWWHQQKTIGYSIFDCPTIDAIDVNNLRCSMVFPGFPNISVLKNGPETVSSALSTGCSTGSGACRRSGEITVV